MSDTGGKPFTIGGFYGVKNKRKWIGIERSVEDVVKKHQSERIPKPYPNRIAGPCTKWQTFFRQQDAFAACRSLDGDVHVFAFESESFEGNTGQRMYLVASYPVFWHYYSQLKLSERHHYEVIPQGAVCRLYFDLEYEKSFNPGKRGDRMVEILIQIMCAALKKEFSVKCSGSDILDLEASTSKKFSRHLIFQMGNVVFKNNIHAGNFISHVMSQILDELQIQKRLTEESTKDENHTATPAIDVKVYSNEEKISNSETSNEDNQSSELTGNISDTVNECHEKLRSEKDKGIEKATGEKTNSSGDDNRAIGGDNATDSEAVRADGSDLGKLLKEFSREDLAQMMVKNKHGEDILFCDLGVYTKNRNFRLYLSSKMNKNNPLRLSSENKYTPPQTSNHSCQDEAVFYKSLVANVKYTNSTRVLTFGDDTDKQLSLPKSQRSKVSVKESIDGYNRSPYPEVDDYISSIITQNGNRGVIRHWTYFHLGELLLYEISHYRYCNNIGRAHRSNNIMYIVDLRKGVFYQKCHDPDCHMQNYKSEEWSLPRQILPAGYFDNDDEDDLEADVDMDDDELLNSTLEMEKQLMSSTGGDKGGDVPDDRSDEELMAAVGQLENG